MFGQRIIVVDIIDAYLCEKKEYLIVEKEDLMNYKTIMICVFLAGTIHQASGMNGESTHAVAPRDIVIAHGGWLMNTSPKDDLFNASQLENTADDLEDLELAELGCGALSEAQKACAAAGINLRNTRAPELMNVAEEYRKFLGTHRCEDPGKLALSIHNALEAHKKSNNVGSMAHATSIFAGYEKLILVQNQCIRYGGISFEKSAKVPDEFKEIIGKANQYTESALKRSQEEGEQFCKQGLLLAAELARVYENFKKKNGTNNNNNQSEKVS